VAQRGQSDGLSLTVHSPGFVGRERELAALADALAGPPSLVLVEGEAGIGKSRLVAESLAREPGPRPLVAACPPFRQPYTLGPVVDGLRRAAGQVAGLRLSGLAGALRPLFPEWAGDLPPAPEPLPDASASRHRLFRALAELAGCLGVGLLVVEDVHWADEATLEFLLFLAAQQPRPVSLLLTCRPDEVPPGSLLLRLSSRPGVPGGVVRLPLGPLSVPETAVLVSSMLDGERVHADFAGFLHLHTEGVPLAVEESVRLLADRADLARRGGEWVRRRSEKISVPLTVRDAVLERAGRLGADAQAVLRAAAVLGQAADEAELAAVAGISPERTVAAVVTALDCGLLGEDGGGGFRFRHVLAAQAVHEAIPAPLRSRMHLRAAQVLEALPRPPAVRLARHFRAAGQTDEWCRYAEQAADLALASGDDPAAAALLYEVITAGGLPPQDIARLARKIPVPAVAAKDTHQGLAAALRAALASDAVGAAEPRVRGLIQYQLSRFLNGMGDFKQARRDLEQAVALLPADSREAARAMLSLSWLRGDLSSPKSVHLGWLRGAVAAAPAIPEGERLAFAMDEATVLLCLGEEEGWDKAAAIPENPPSARDRIAIATAGQNFGHLAILWGRYAEARRRLDRALDLAVTHEFTRISAGIQVTLAHLRWFTGEWDGPAGQAAAVLELGRLVPSVQWEAMLVAGLLLCAAGDVAQADEYLERAVAEALSRESPGEYLEPAAALARLRLAGGDAALAVTLTDEPAAVVSGKDAWVWAADLVPVRAAALAAVGRLAEADGLVAGYAAGLAGHSGPVARTHLVESRAILAAAREEHEEAAALWASAAAAWRALPRPYDALRAGEQRARSLLAAGRTDTAARDEGLEVLSAVLRGLEELGAAGDTARVARRLRENGVTVASVWRGGPRGYGTELSPRELDVVRLVATGQSNRQIAALVHRSPDTVATQLKSAMRKLGVSSRTALAVRAAEAGIVPGATD
jgi:DNA-binding CsgD family transcriptional regulator/tetratricopeptide (TPR) repeat protein